MTTEIGRGTVDIHATIVGTSEEAARLADLLRVEVGAVAGLTPTVRINAVPQSDAQAPRVASARIVNPDQATTDLRTATGEALADLWPEASAGPMLGFTVGVGARPPSRVEIVHAGMSMDAAALEMLRTTLSRRLNTPVDVMALSVERSPVAWVRSNTDEWLARIEVYRRAAAVVGGRVCAEAPRASALPAGDRTLILGTLDRWARLDGARFDRREGAALTAHISTGPCGEPGSGQ